MSGVAGLSRGITSINRLKSSIKGLPVRIRSSVAQDAAGYLDVQVRAEFDAGQTVFATPRPLGVNGNKLTLIGGRTAPARRRHVHADNVEALNQMVAKRAAYQSRGHVRDSLGFVAIGTVIRAQLGQKYARFLIGKYRILPMKLPSAWAQYLTKLVDEYRADFEGEAAR